MYLYWLDDPEEALSFSQTEVVTPNGNVTLDVTDPYIHMSGKPGTAAQTTVTPAPRINAPATRPVLIRAFP